jgi:hypothetical protein
MIDSINNNLNESLDYSSILDASVLESERSIIEKSIDLLTLLIFKKSS